MSLEALRSELSSARAATDAEVAGLRAQVERLRADLASEQARLAAPVLAPAGRGGVEAHLGFFCARRYTLVAVGALVVAPFTNCPRLRLRAAFYSFSSLGTLAVVAQFMPRLRLLSLWYN